MSFELKVEEEQGKHQLEKSFKIEVEWVHRASDTGAVIS